MAAGFGSGSGSALCNDGTNLARRGDVVVVTINHRLNVLGFANFSAFSPDFAASGEVGMLDIVHALRWVRTNIAQFGGDPDTVMIFGAVGWRGESARPFWPCPSAKGLFHRAALESGVALRVVDHAVAVENAGKLLAELGLSKTNVRDIQKLPLEQVMDAYFAVSRGLGKVDASVVGFSPSVDGSILPQHPFDPVAAPVSADVPVLLGCTRTEWTGLTTDATLWRLDEAGMRAQVTEMLGDRATEMIDLYRRHNPVATPSELFFLIASGLSLWRPDTGDRRASGGAEKRPGLSVLFCLGNSRAGRIAQDAA